MKKLNLSTAQITGLFYLGLAITGVLAFLYARDQLLVDGDALATTANLIENETTARLGIAAEFGLVVFQALAAVWFFKLFRKKNSFGAGLIAAFGLINAAAILISSAMWLGALNTALAGGAEQAVTTQTLFDLHETIWVASNLFFGLWLLPMAYMVRASKMPAAMAWFLYAGGIGYLLAAFVAVLVPDNQNLPEVLAAPATVGEFWIIGYLLFKKVPTS